MKLGYKIIEGLLTGAEWTTWKLSCFESWYYDMFIHEEDPRAFPEIFDESIREHEAIIKEDEDKRFFSNGEAIEEPADPVLAIHPSQEKSYHDLIKESQDDKS